MFRVASTFGRARASSCQRLTSHEQSTPFTIAQRTATKKAGGTVTNSADSPGQRMGVKKFGGERIYSQNIIIRQKGTKWHPGVNVYCAKDFTLHAKIDGYVRFFKMPIPSKVKNRYRTYVNVLPTREGGEEELITFAAQVKKQKLDAVAYRKGQKKFMKDMRNIYGPAVSREEYIVDKGKERILSRIDAV